MFSKSLTRAANEAIRQKNPKLTLHLISKGAAIEPYYVMNLFYDHYGKTKTSPPSDIEDWVQVLINSNRVNYRYIHWGNTILMYASFRDRDDLVKILLAAKANPRIQNDHHEDALKIAVERHSNKCIEILLSEVTNRDECIETALPEVTNRKKTHGSSCLIL